MVQYYTSGCEPVMFSCQQTSIVGEQGWLVYRRHIRDAMCCQDTDFAISSFTAKTATHFGLSAHMELYLQQHNESYTPKQVMPFVRQSNKTYKQASYFILAQAACCSSLNPSFLQCSMFSSAHLPHKCQWNAQLFKKQHDFNKQSHLFDFQQFKAVNLQPHDF